MMIRDFCFLIFCYGRPQLAKSHSWRIIKELSNHKAFIVLSDDDKTIPDYEKEFGKENIYIFNKNEIEKKTKFDLVDCYHGEHNFKKGVVWARNAQYIIAKDLGYRYFSAWDDDIKEVNFRVPSIKNHQLFLKSIRIPNNSFFDNVCEYYFRILDSAPWLYSLALPQGGDFLGGVDSDILRRSKFKAMDVIFFDTEKEVRYNGRINEDVNCYVEHNLLGQLQLTLSNYIMFNQEPTQRIKGGATDLYLKFGTYLKSLYTCIQHPNCSAIDILHSKYKRIHHKVVWNNTVPLIVSDKYCKHDLSNYKDNLMKITYNYDKEKKEYIFKEKKHSFLENECEVLETPIKEYSIETYF